MNHATIVHEAGAETTTVMGIASVEALAVEPDDEGLAALRVEYTDEDEPGETFHRAFVEDVYGGVMPSTGVVVGASYAVADEEPVGRASIPPRADAPDPLVDGPVAYQGVVFAKRVISAERGPAVVLVGEEGHHVVSPLEQPGDLESVPRGDLPGNRPHPGPDVVEVRGVGRADLEIGVDAAFDAAVEEAIRGEEHAGDDDARGDGDADDEEAARGDGGGSGDRT